MTDKATMPEELKQYIEHMGARYYYDLAIIHLKQRKEAADRLDSLAAVAGRMAEELEVFSFKTAEPSASLSAYNALMKGDRP